MLILLKITLDLSDFMSCVFVKNCSKIHKKKYIVNDITIEFHQNQVVGILGPNGAGKTTCFNIIAGMIKPDSGSIMLNNIDITNFPIYKRAKAGISYLPQDPSIFKTLTVEENIFAVLEFFHHSYDERMDIAQNLLSEFNILHLREVIAGTLSGGERRRLEVARTFCINPNFILMDEPFAGVDPISVKDIKKVISKLKNKGIGVLITDHNAQEIIDITDYIYVMYSGKILFSGATQDVLKNEDVRRLYLGNF